MFPKSLRSGLAAVALSLAAILPAHADSWQLLGEQRVGHRPDYDSFHVGRDAGHYGALKFRALGSQVAVADVKVIYSNGSSEHLNVREHLAPGTTTTAYDLKGTHRRIERIDILYQNEGHGRHAKMQVFGLKYDGPTPFPHPYPGHGNGGDSAGGYGWENLGTHPVSTTVDHDTIKLGFDRGRFRAIKLQVLDRDIELYNLRVTFGNGDVQEIPVNGTVYAGMTTAPLDLSGHRRWIDRIDLVYRTKGDREWFHRTQYGYGHGGQARVTVFGLH